MHLKYLNYKFLLTLFLSVCFFGFSAAPLSERARISLLTCDQGNEIYSLFGHSAIRVQDPELGIDEVYNWGMFEFSENELLFGYDFAKGRLLYFLGKQKYQNFIYEYLYYKRGVREQLLNLNEEQKEKLYIALQENYLPENRAYKYDFFYDNCSSRIRDILITSIGENLSLATHSDDNKYSFRNIIDLRLQNTPWLDLGIDLVLGKKIDVKASNYHLMFLPVYMEEIVAKSTIKKENGKEEPLVANTTILLLSEQDQPTPPEDISFYFWTLLAACLLVGILNINKLNNFYFGGLLLIGSLLGIILLFMWLGTDHQATKQNLNLIWANPLLAISFLALFSKKWMAKLKYFFLGYTLILFVFVLFWFVSPQEFNFSIRPLILTFMLIHYFLFNKAKKLSKHT
jgi:hypothetical protein